MLCSCYSKRDCRATGRVSNPGGTAIETVPGLCKDQVKLAAAPEIIRTEPVPSKSGTGWINSAGNSEPREDWKKTE